MIKSAGFILVRKDNNQHKFLLLRCFNLWEPAKGKQDGEESSLQTAYRETEEETGIGPAHIILLTGETYTTEPYTKPLKTATFFLGLCNTDKVVFRPNPETNRVEHHEYKWVSYNDAMGLVNDRIGKALSWAEEVLTDLGIQ